jgi:GNAT superfamily N-acetyltransferase
LIADPEQVRVNDAADILRATESDLAPILELQRLAYQSEARLYKDPNIAPLIQTLPELRAEFSERLFLKAQVDDSLAGSVRAHRLGDTCHIGRLVVHPEWQGRGIGTALMTGIEQRFSDVCRYELFTGCRSERNIAFYSKLGYTAYRRDGVLVFMQKRNRAV